MKNGIDNGYYHEITPQGFGLAIKAKEVLSEGLLDLMYYYKKSDDMSLRFARDIHK